MNKKTVETEKYYDILVNDDEEIMIAIKVRESEPENPVVVYAGGEHAVLCRDDERMVVLDFINPGVRGLLGKTKEVLIVELDDGELAREYIAPVRQEKKLPVSEKEIS